MYSHKRPVNTHTPPAGQAELLEDARQLEDKDKEIRERERGGQEEAPPNTRLRGRD
jgi:hypothetical protein